MGLSSLIKIKLKQTPTAKEKNGAPKKVHSGPEYPVDARKLGLFHGSCFWKKPETVKPNDAGDW